jgi:putative NADH-flavin reductase
MKLAIFGATGRTGRQLVCRALASGYEVNAIIRNQGHLLFQHDLLHLFYGDLDETGLIHRSIDSVDAVISALGPKNNKPLFEISQATKKIITSMKDLEIRRLVASAGAGVRSSHDSPRLIDHGIQLLLKITSRWIYEDMVRTVEEIRSSGLDWTVVRVPMLIDGHAANKIKVGWVGKSVGMRITRDDLAAFMIEQINSDQFLRQDPAISN